MGFDYTTLITNRTATDVQSAKNLTQKVKDGKTLSPQEKELFDKGLKGCYNASIDLNRVELACQDLSNRLNKYGYKVNITTKTDWNITDIPTVEQFNRIKQNIQALKDAYYILSTTPSVPEQDRNKLTYSEANDMEKIFIDLDYLIRSMIQDFIYCGVCNCGQDRIWQQRFRRKRNWEGIPFNTFSQFLSSVEIKNITTQSDTIDMRYAIDSSVYGNILYYNNKLNQLDNVIGGNE